MEYIKMSKDVLDVLSSHGVIEFHVFEFTGDYTIEKVEEKFRTEFDNSIVNVFKIGDGSFIVEVFVVDEKLDEVKKAHLESYIYLSGLERFAKLYRDKDFEYVVKKFIKSDKKRINMLTKLTYVPL